LKQALYHNTTETVIKSMKGVTQIKSLQL
jgi:hypothetical protein